MIQRLRRAATAIIVILVILAPAALSACQNPDYIYTEDGAVECGADGNPIVLSNNPDAVDPTFEQLMAFIEADPTDTNAYVEDRYVCADFAEEVHNHAEAAGIRAGWVGIMFENAEIGHALNVFETTDRGTVYIDCTNGAALNPENGGKGWDMIAYLEEGKPYGVIPIDDVIGTGLDYYPLIYDYYAEREAAWTDYSTALADYNAGVQDFNAATRGKTFIIGSAEHDRITAWKNDLMEQEKTLKAYQSRYGSYWYESQYSSYTVLDIAIHW